MIFKRFLLLAAAPFLLASINATTTALAQVVKVNQCEIAFTPGDGALNTIVTQLNAATNSVDVAMFRLSNQELVDALCVLARDRKVAVRVILDAEDIATPADGTRYDPLRQQLVRNGCQVLVYAATNELGTTKTMHLRCAVIDDKTVMTGSCNWRANSFKDKVDDLIVLQSPGLAALYTAELNQVVQSTTPLPYTGPTPMPTDKLVFPVLHRSDNGSTPAALVINKPFKASVYFSPEASGFSALAKQIRSATNQVDMAMRYLGYPKINKAILDAASNGIPVRLAMDKDMFGKRFKIYEAPLEQKAVALYGSKLKEPGLHMKISVIDNQWLWTGSANATAKADTLDIEDMLQINSPDAATAYRQVLNRLTTWFDKKTISSQQ